MKLNHKKNPENTVGVGFHRFPIAHKMKDLYSKWIHAVKRVNPVSTLFHNRQIMDNELPFCRVFRTFYSGLLHKEV